MQKIRIGIVGHGNIGRGVENAIKQNPDTELIAVFTRRPPESIQLLTSQAEVKNISEAEKYLDRIDVMILCGGSAKDLPQQGPQFAAMFNTVDSYDNHAKIPEYLKQINEATSNAGKTNIISVGWDPGLFSMLRMISGAILPQGNDYTFWGKGVSQGHSDAIRRVKGVKNGIQYTIPIESAVSSVRKGENPKISTREKHFRECFVVALNDADQAQITEDIKNMPNYFADYDTTVHFITEEEMQLNHSRMTHGGFVFRTGTTGNSNLNKHIIEFSLKLDSNPEFTANVMVAYARAAFRMNQEGLIGAKTVFDVPLSYLSASSNVDLIKDLL
ncbi:MAG: diaminopimelate dehydrogenase [Syntrophomonadaceae bacterium]|nr:diaminopimelate dehydrogenase [Syntrophomonadaceae bacterium]